MPRVPDAVFRAPKGVHDVLPPESGVWANLVGRFADRASRFGYGLVVSPVFEHVEVFQRVGEHTDVVSKEMYELTDKGGRRLALRPEGTASVVRAYVQHHPTPPWKVWYVAPNFRYERAQKGRYRQHWQLGVEALGVDDPAVDVEVIALLDGFYRDLGLTGITLALNSMGDAASRPAYLDALGTYLLGHADALGRGVPRAGGSEPDAGPRHQGAGVAGGRRAGAAAARIPLGPGTRALRAGAGGAGRRSGSRTSSRPASSAGSTTTRARRSSSRATRSTRPRTRWGAAGATTVWPRRWAGRRPRASASAPASSGSCSPWRPRARRSRFAASTRS